MKRGITLNELEFISNIISSLAWPISILIIVWILKDHLINTISSIKNLKYKDVELSFSNELSKIEDKYSNNESHAAKNSTDEDVKTVAEISPSVSVLFAWTFLEKSLVACRENLSLDNKLLDHEKSPNYSIRYLKENNYIDEETYLLIQQLRHMRNIAAHQYKPDTNISFIDAIKYYDLVQQVIAKLEKIN